MAQRGKAPATKSNELSWTHGTHKVKGRTDSGKQSSDLHTRIIS